MFGFAPPWKRRVAMATLPTEHATMSAVCCLLSTALMMALAAFPRAYADGAEACGSLVASRGGDRHHCMLRKRGLRKRRPRRHEGGRAGGAGPQSTEQVAVDKGEMEGGR